MERDEIRLACLGLVLKRQPRLDQVLLEAKIFEAYVTEGLHNETSKPSASDKKSKRSDKNATGNSDILS